MFDCTGCVSAKAKARGTRLTGIRNQVPDDGPDLGAVTEHDLRCPRWRFEDVEQNASSSCLSTMNDDGVLDRRAEFEWILEGEVVALLDASEIL